MINFFEYLLLFEIQICRLMAREKSFHPSSLCVSPSFLHSLVSILVAMWGWNVIDHASEHKIEHWTFVALCMYGHILSCVFQIINTVQIIYTLKYK